MKTATKELSLLINNADMIRALLDRTKTQMRLPIILPKSGGKSPLYLPIVNSDGMWSDSHCEPFSCPFGVPGEKLWVKETWRRDSVKGLIRNGTAIVYHADDSVIDYPDQKEWFESDWNKETNHRHAQFAVRWKPPLHMPQHFSRIRIEVIRIWTEWLQDITEESASAEGIVQIDRSLHLHGRMDGFGVLSTPPEEAYTTRKNAFASVWDTTTKWVARKWDANPQVFAAEFNVADQPQN